MLIAITEKARSCISGDTFILKTGKVIVDMLYFCPFRLNNNPDIDGVYTLWKFVLVADMN